MIKATVVVLFALALYLFAVSIASAQNANPPSSQPKPVPLWPDGAPGAKGSALEDIPSIQLYQPPADKASGAAIVVCPGGGYGRLAPHEGHDVAVWLGSIGVTAVVLKYRLGPRYQHPAMMQDVMRAIRFTRSKASEWKIDPNRVGVMGFSAGGHLASTAATHFDAGDPSAKDPIERIKSRPDVAILCYAVITMTDPHTHKGSRKNLLGDAPSQEMIDLMSNEKRVNAATPPAFLFHTADDAAVTVENSLLFAAGLRKAGVPHELHVYERGRHGVGLAQNDPALSTWPRLLENWLRAHGFLNPARISEAAPPKPRDPEIKALIDELRNTPPEFAAHAMIAIARHPEVDDSWKAEILEEAFVFASQARHPVMMKYLDKFHTETRTGYRSRAFDLRLDRLSLQTAVLKHLVELKPAKALELWNQIEKPELAPLRCDETLLYDVADYYRFLPAFARKALTQEQIRNEEHTRFVEAQLRQLRSSAEIIPASDAIFEFKPNVEQFDSMVKAYSRGLESIERDDRSFHYAAESAAAVISTMASECQRRNIAPGYLIESCRDMLIRQLGGPRCTDNYYPRGRPVTWPQFVSEFNRLLRAYKPNLTIEEESIRPTKIDVEPAYHAYWQTRPAQSLFRRLNQLRYGAAGSSFTRSFAIRPPWLPDFPRSDRRMPARDEPFLTPTPPQPLPLKDRLTLQWQQQLVQYLRELSQWKPEQERLESDYFHQKCRIYNSLIEITPKGNLFDRILSEYCAYLSVNRFNRDSFTDWFLHVSEIVRRSRTMDKEESELLLEALRTADDPVLRLYIKLQPYFDAASKEAARREVDVKAQ